MRRTLRVPAPMRAATLVLAPLVAAGAATLVPLTWQQASASPVVPAAFAFQGSGWGHGVGMSQYGAQGMAVEGAKARKILKHYYSGTKVKGVKDDKNVWVSLKNGVSDVRLRSESLGAGGGSISITAGPAIVKGGPSDAFALVAEGTQVKVVKNGAAVAIAPKVAVRWAGTRFKGKNGTGPTLVNLVTAGQSLDTSGHRYRYGRVVVRNGNVSGARALQVSNVVRLHDEYLYGVAEMPSSWRMAALRAQAVAARSYAYVKAQRAKRPSCYCHLDSGVSDQVFAGYVKESSTAGARWRKAVDKSHDSATVGEVVTYAGTPVQTYYSSSTGGRTQNSEDVWTSALPYLRSVDDRWSLNASNPYASWGPARRTQAELAAAFGITDIVSIDLSDRYVSGAIRTARATNASGQAVSITGATLTSRLKLTSRWVRAVAPSA
jgi:stage II sporulation protein D